MATLTIRNLQEELVDSLKILAQRNGRSMEQEVREILEDYVEERLALLKRIEASWDRQSRRPTADEVEAWIRAGRE